MTGADKVVNPLHLNSDPADSHLLERKLSLKATKLQGVRCTWSWRRCALSDVVYFTI